MSQGSVIAVLAGCVLVAVLALALAGGLGASRVETSGGSPVPGSFEGPPADASRGIVMSTHQSKSPVQLFGLKFGSSRWEASIAMALPEGCEPNGGEVTADGSCSKVAASGQVSGGGTTAAGLEFVIVSVPVSEQCHVVLTPGERWPTSHPECAR